MRINSINTNQDKYNRWLVWQGHINEVGQKLYKSWVDFKAMEVGQKLVKTWSAFEAKKAGQYAGRMSAVYKAIQNLDETWTEIFHQFFTDFSSKNVPEVSLKCHHQTTTEIPPGMTDDLKCPQMSSILACGRKIGSIRVKSDQKIGVNRVKSVQILTSVSTKVSADECKCGQKIRVNRGEIGVEKCDQMLPNATKNKALTYQRLILLNSSFMLCC